MPISSPLVAREFLEDRARHFETALGGLIGVGGGADCNFLSGLDVAQFLAQQIRRHAA